MVNNSRRTTPSERKALTQMVRDLCPKRTTKPPKPREVEPLKKRTMTLDELQRRTVKTIRMMQKQLKRKHYHGGMTDDEFSDQVLNTLANDIYCDRIILGTDTQLKQEHGSD